MKLVTRSAWGAARPRQVTARDPSLLKGVVVHWFGSPSSAKNHSDCDDLVRSVQRGHQAGEFVDVAYNHLVCRHGYVYEGRGFGVQTGANGTGQTNEDYAAVCYMAGVKDLSGAFSDGGKRALAEIIDAWLQKAGNRGRVITHGSITGSECPGPTLREWVEASGFAFPNDIAWKKKRLATLRLWILAKAKKDGWDATKDTANWQEYKRLGGE